MVDDGLVVFLAGEVVLISLAAEFDEVVLVVSESVCVAYCAAAAVGTAGADCAGAAEVVLPVGF